MLYGLRTDGLSSLLSRTRQQLYRVIWLVPVVVLFIFVGPRIELIGLTLGLFVLSLNPSDRGAISLLQAVIAAVAAAMCGFRIWFFTDPSGGYFYLSWLSLPLTVVWILVILRSRAILFSALPFPRVQLSFDFVLVVNALLVTMVASQTREEPIAFHLILSLLGVVLLAAIVSHRYGTKLARIAQRTTAFGLALFAISGVMKTPLSLSLLAPFVLVGVPLVGTSYGFVAEGVTSRKIIHVPSWFLRLGYSQNTFLLLLLVLASSVANGAVIAVKFGYAYGLTVLGIVPSLVIGHMLRKKVDVVLEKPWTGENGDKAWLFGVGFNQMSNKEAASWCINAVASGRSTKVVVTPNSVSLLRARSDPSLLSAYNRADLVTADGIGIVWGASFLGASIPERVTGIDLVNELLRRADSGRYRVFLLGGKHGVATRAAKHLQRQFSGLSVVGTYHGYFDDDSEVMAEIREAKPDIVLAGMGVPKQELWMTEHREELSVSLMIGVGGALDVYAGDRRRASVRWQRLGLEWLYRLLDAPHRISVVFSVPYFIIRVLLVRLVMGFANVIDLQNEQQI